MYDTRIAVLSDIHGNRLALESVLLDVTHKGIRNIVNLGDCLYGPLDPAGTAQLLMKLDFPTVRGNEDRIIVQPPSGQELSPTIVYTRDSLGHEALNWLENFSKTIVFHKNFFLCHGSPDRDDENGRQDWAGWLRTGLAL